MSQHVSIDDFWPPYEPTAADFYPAGFAFKKQQPKCSLGPESAALIIALTERLISAKETEIEILTIIKFCEALLQQSGLTAPGSASDPSEVE